MPDAFPPKIGKYEVRTILGEGGFGRVYLAFDPQVGRPVALKVLNSQSSPDMLVRFQNEASAAGNLHHENIVTIYEFGVYNGAPFIAMEYLEGSDLNQIMASGQPLSLLEKVRIMSQVGQGLQCAHEHGVVHRDVKPANIKVLPNRLVKIMDFGIARLTHDEGTRLTHKGDLIGTVRYMSPEQFQGLDVNLSCDIFAYGVIFYELVSGKHPFQAPTFAAFMTTILESEPVPLTRVVPGCPPSLELIVMRALEKNRDVRYQSLEDLLLDMRPLMLELQKERAAELFSLAHGLFSSGQATRAQAFIREIIELDSSNPDVWDLREQIQSAAYRMTVRPKVEALIKTAEQNLAARLFAEAIESLETAAKLDPADSAIPERLNEARRQMDAALRAVRLLSDANRELDRKNLTLAERLASQALVIDPRNNEALNFVDTLRQDLERRENERRLKAALDEARRSAAFEDFDTAIEKLEALRDIRDPAGEIPALLNQLRDQKMEHARQERLRSEKQTLRGILREARFSDALARLESLYTEFPDDRDIQMLLADTRQQLRAKQREEDIRNAKVEATSYGAVGNFAEAEQVLRRLSDAYPGDAEIVFLAQTAARAREEHDRQQKLDDVVRTSDQLQNDLRFEEAASVLNTAQREFGHNATLTEARKRLDAQWSAHRRAERVRQALDSARATMAGGHFDSAISLLKKVSAEDPSHPEIENLLHEARRLSEVQRADRAIDQACTQARELANTHSYDAAITQLRRVLQQYPGDPRLEGLQEAISAQKQRWESEQRVREAIRYSTQLIRERRFPEAVHALELQLAKDPGEPALVKLLNQAKSDWESSKGEEALERVLDEIRSLIDQNRQDEAAVLMEHCSPEFGSYPSFIALRSHLDDLLRKSERSRRIAEVKAQIANLELQGNLAGALQSCQSALVKIPDAPELLDLYTSLQQRDERYRRDAEAARLTASVRQAMVMKDWTAAGKGLDQLTRQFGDEPTLAGLKKDVRLERQRAEAEQVFAAFDQAVNSGDWPAAERQLATATAIAPDDPRLAGARRCVERRRRRDRTLSEARTALKKGRFDEAEALLNPIVADDVSDADASSLLQEARSQRAAAEVQADIRQGRQQANSLSNQRKFEAAIGVLRELMDRYGAQPDLENDLRQISAAAERQRAVLSLQELRRTGQAEQVLEETTSLLQQEDIPEVRELRNWAETTLQMGRAPAPAGPEPEPSSPSDRNEVLARLDWLMRLGDLDGAAAALMEGLRIFPDDPALLAWKARLVSEKMRREERTPPSVQPVSEKVRSEERTPPSVHPVPSAPRRKLLVFSGVGAAALLIGSLVAVKLLTHPPLPPLGMAAASLKEGRTGEPYSATLSGSGGVAPYRWSVSRSALPPDLTLEADTGAIRGTPKGEGRFDFAVRVSDHAGHSVDSELSLTVQPASSKTQPASIETPPPAKTSVPLTLTTSALPEGKVRVPYDSALQASGGSPPYRWSTTNKLPAGLSLNAGSGTIRGTPTADGKFTLRVRVTDKEGESAEGTSILSIQGAAAPVTPLTLTTGALPAEGKVGAPYAGTLAASGGTPPYQWSISRGRIPLGLQLDSTHGAIRGTPSAEGKFDFSIRLSDRTGAATEGAAAVAIRSEPKAEVKTEVKAEVKPVQPSAGLRCPPAEPAQTQDAYFGAKAGSIEWKGTPVPGHLVMIVSNRVEGGGFITPQSKVLLGGPVTLDAGNTRIVEPPSKQNGWSCFVFQPDANSVKISWKLDWTLNQR
jgi:serine/threonine protein kinase